MAAVSGALQRSLLQAWPAGLYDLQDGYLCGARDEKHEDQEARKCIHALGEQYMSTTQVQSAADLREQVRKLVIDNIECPKCGAKPGEQCGYQGIDGTRQYRRTVHPQRKGEPGL